MFKIESYVTPILLSYVDKYVRDFNPADAQVSLWGGGVALHNLVLKADVLQQEVALPFTLVSGRIHELLIQVPWTKIMSEPIVVTIDTIECILSLNPSDGVVTETPRAKTQVVETPPGYMQALVRRVVTNIALRVHHLIVKYVHDDLVLSLNVKHLAVDSAAPDWTPTFADIDAELPVIRRTVRLDDLTLCLDRSDADGKIRFYQEPLLYRCQLDFRVLIGLTSANTRRAKNIEVQLRSQKLGWSITNEQLVMLLRLLREQPTAATPPPPPKTSTQNNAQPLHSSSNLAEPTRNESWSEWAWSWLPAWGDGTGEVEEAPLSPTPAPLKFTVYLDHVSLVFKIMEVETTGRKRPRAVLEASAWHVAARTQRCAPTAHRARVGVRNFTLRAHPGCLCGFTAAQGDETIVFLSKVGSDDQDEWTWPYVDLDEAVEIAVAIDEKYQYVLDESEPDIGTSKRMMQSINQLSEEPIILIPQEPVPDNDEFWKDMAPVVFVEFIHNRAPADPFTNPYENPPTDFEYSDWVEEWKMKVTVQPLIVRLCSGVLHRLAAIQTILTENLPATPQDTPMRVLTVEECEYLNENLPQRQMSVDVRGLRIQVLPWSHSSQEKPAPPSIILDFELPGTNLLINAPLYPDRVCQAACQMPEEEGPVWRGARVHASGELREVELRVTSPGGQPRPCARLQARFVFHCLLYPKYFTKKRTNLVNYTLKISEMNICGSAARLQTAWQILQSLLLDRQSTQLRQTTLARDALNDEEWVAIDMTCEDVSLRSYITKHIMTNIVTLHSARATALHAPSGKTVRQAWLFSAPDSASATPFFRGAIQLCSKPVSYARDFVALWTEPIAICVDPLFIAWLAYKPQTKPVVESPLVMGLKPSSTSMQYMLRRRVTPPSSSGRVSGSGAEFVHATRPRSSSSEPSERRDSKPTPLPAKPVISWWDREKLPALHSRMKRARLSAEVGLVLVYVTATSASAVDCVCVRDAMERHAATEHRVLALSLGRLSAHTSGQMKHLWQEIRHDGPTFFKPKADTTTEEDYFPWKLRIADISCYTLEMRSTSAAHEGHERSTMGLRSKLKIPCAIVPKTILELITITATLSVVTKSMHITSWVNPHEKKRGSTSSSVKSKPEAQKTRYFTTGLEFKPHTLKEFVRGPARRQLIPSESQLDLKFDQTGPIEKTTCGPLLSLGVNLHIDTPPIVVRLDQEQVCVASMAAHCLQHVLALFKQDKQIVQRQEFTSMGSSHRSLIRSVSEIDELNSQSEETEIAELIPIFEPHHTAEVKLKSFFWFQWVVNRATLIVSSGKVKLAFEIEDVITTVDLQAHYDQLKIKVASASIRHYVRGGGREWTPGKMNGRVLEVREPANDKEDEQFLTITITQAQISNLPASWKEELHPKLLQQPSTDSMWEIYMTLAPLEAVLHGELLDDIVSLAKELSPISYCPLQTRSTKSAMGPWQWPFCYLTAGGLRLIITSEKQDDNADDTILFHIGRISINPHPDNPICRRLISSGVDTGWTTANSGHHEGRQYELSVKHVGLQSTHFAQLLHYEEIHHLHRQGTGLGNPAVKWSQTRKAPVITTILYNVDVGCVGAPALFVGGSLACGPGLDISLVSDCAIELNVAQLRLLRTLARQLSAALKQGPVHEEYWDDQVNFDVCPYVTVLKRTSVVTEEIPAVVVDTTNIEVELKSTTLGQSGVDSGVDTATSYSTSKMSRREETPHRRPVSVAFAENTGEPSDHLEMFVTMGVIEVSLFASPPTPPPSVCVIREVTANELLDRPHFSTSSSEESLSVKKEDTILHLDKLPDEIQDRDKTRNFSVPLLHMTLHQPNLYYWKRKSQKTLQMSLFDTSLSVGLGSLEDLSSSPLVSTARGTRDPVTDIPPALVTLKLVVPATGGLLGGGGSVRLDVERPVQLQVSTKAVLRLQEIRDMINKNETKTVDEFLIEKLQSVPFLYRLRRLMGREGIESVVVETGQVSACGEEGSVGWGAASAQVAVGSRAERLTARALVSALAVAAGPPADTRRLLLHPTIIGIEAYASWDAWRRAEGSRSAREPIVSVVVDVDHVTLDLSPADVDALGRIRNGLAQILPQQIFPSPKSPESVYQMRRNSLTSHTSVTSEPDPTDDADHYYKDDLRSGAFKIVGGGQLPMAYQVLLHDSAVSWRYPHPRAITRVIAFPLPDQDEEVKCVLEMYNTMLSQWEPHTYFKLPVREPRELLLYSAPPEATFAVMWRFRVYDNDEPSTPFEFNIHKYKPRPDPFVMSSPPDVDSCKSCAVTAEQLSGVLRVDSYFAPRLLPRYKLAGRICAFELHLHNALSPTDCSQTAGLEGYYVTRPLTHSHRVLTLSARETAAHARLHSPAGKLMLLQTNISGDIIECDSGTMQRVVSESHVQCAFASAEAGAPSGRARARLRCSQLLVALNAPRIRTLLALARDWSDAYKKFKETEPTSKVQQTMKTDSILSEDEKCDVEAAMVGLEGRVSLWVHNETSAPLRVGQDGTDELMPLPAAVRLAYRWRCPASPKSVRFALAGPSADWVWSNSIPFLVGSYRVRLGDSDNSGSESSDQGSFLHVKVEEFGSRRCMRVSGRFALANMLRHDILYKLNVRDPETKQWRTVAAGELQPETVGGSVICSADNELALKIKFPTHDKGWSGDIPLKECPKENVPWLVKVPSTGSVPYTSVWCRVVRTRAEGRLLAALWPLYVLHSHLPLDTDVTITSEGEAEEMPALVQSAAGRGATTHLMAPGTTAHKHSLTFRYRDFDSSVTREAAPLHYGVTQVSVFEKRQPVQSIEDLMPDILGWLERYGLNSKSSWPYSIVTSHWPLPWQYALLQPRCDVTVRYNGVVAGGGGCGLAVHLCPLALFCNASPLALTLRAHDATPLCKLEPGQAIAPPSTLLTRPFFMSMEIGREVFVSGQLQVGSENLGRYGCPPPGVVALEREACIAIQCNHKVALLTMFYEIKEDINVIGLTSTYVLINRLDVDIQVSAIAVPNDTEDDAVLTPKTFKVVPPTAEGSVHGTPLTKLWVWRRWRGREPHELRGYLCVTLGGGSDARPVPLRLGHPPLRRAIALHDDKDQSRAVVVTQVSHEGRWVVTVADDPCPQFVVHNRTDTPLAVAQPRPLRDRPDALHIKAMSECAGAEWVCEVGAGVATHYSTPGHNARYPPDPAAGNNAAADLIPMLTFSKIAEGESLVWCPPVAATGGEQLLQLSGVTVKMRVYSYPHSTLVELHDVHQLDISASDIRRRLQGSITSDQSDTVLVKNLQDTQTPTLERVNAKEQLPVHGQTPTASNKQEIAIKAPALDAVEEAAASPTVSVTTLTERSSEVKLKDSNDMINVIQAGTIENPDKAKTEVQQDNVQIMELKLIDKNPVTKIESPTNANLGSSGSVVTLDKGIIPVPGSSVSVVTLDKANIPSPDSSVSIVTLDKANIPAPKRLLVSDHFAPATKLDTADAKSAAADAKTHKPSFFYDAILSNPDTDIVKLTTPLPDILPTLSDIITSNITLTTESVTPDIPIATETDIVTPNIMVADESVIVTSTTSTSTESNVVASNDLLTTEVENVTQTSTAFTENTAQADSEQDKTTVSLENKAIKDLKRVVLCGESEVKSLSMDSCLDHDEDLQNLEEKGPVLDPVTAFLAGNDGDSSTSFVFQDPEWGESCGSWTSSERARCVVTGIVVELATTPDAPPLLAAHLDRVALLVLTDAKGTRTIVSVSNVQVDNMQYESGQFDFAVVATTGGQRVSDEESTGTTPCYIRLKDAPLWAIFLQREEFATKQHDARLLLRIRHDRWTVLGKQFDELTEVEVRLGPLALYVEDALVAAGEPALRLLLPTAPRALHPALADSAALQNPLRLRMLYIHPLDLTLTLHTAVRVYIALDQSPLRLSAFRLRNLMTSSERLSHALTVHYLSAAILGAGWVVGGLELLGAPGALAARVSSASGGVRGVAAAAAAALLRSVSAAACSLARNLDLLAGDEEHARRAAAARRLTPPSLIAGLVAGVTNFAINILGAVGGLAHHPLLGVAAGETESSATALRRGLVGALAKPLSATADLVAYAGHGLLSQTGWDPVPQPRGNLMSDNEERSPGWKRDCVRWAFRLAETRALAGFEVLLNNAPLHLLLTHKYLVVVDPDSERIMEMIDYRFCTLAPYQGPVIELSVRQRRVTRVSDARTVDEDDEYKMSSVAMARVARYTGADGGAGGSAGAAIGGEEARALALVPPLGRSLALHAALQAALHHNSDAHFSLL